jgi:muramoyltetrapeptide carboxypeptidase
MNCPPFLQKGDKIALVAPARKVSREELNPALSFIENQGWQAVFDDDLFGAFHQWSGTDSQRIHQLQRYLDDESIKMIWCVRGGYGTMRIIDHLNWIGFRKSPKWILGFSDITVFLQHLVHQQACCGIHGPVALTLNKGEQTSSVLASVLKGEYKEIIFPPSAFNRPGVAKGILHGGNLSLLYALQASAQDFVPDGSILFIEDLDEYFYHIDRMMVSLKRSGKLKNLGALIVGGMTDMRDNETPFGSIAEEIIWDAVKEYDYPVCFNFPAGHITNNHALIFGESVRINVSSSDCTLSYLHGAAQ